jgi:hypothetical protein
MAQHRGISPHNMNNNMSSINITQQTHQRENNGGGNNGVGNINGVGGNISPLLDTRGTNEIPIAEVTNLRVVSGSPTASNLNRFNKRDGSEFQIGNSYSDVPTNCNMAHARCISLFWV